MRVSRPTWILHGRGGDGVRLRLLLLEVVALVLPPPPPRAPLADLDTRFRRLRGDTEVERDDDEDDDDEERDDSLEALPLELLSLELLPLLAALLERELLVDAVLLFFVRSRLRSFLASADRTRFGLAAMIAAAWGVENQLRTRSETIAH